MTELNRTNKKELANTRNYSRFVIWEVAFWWGLFLFAYCSPNVSYT